MVIKSLESKKGNAVFDTFLIIIVLVIIGVSSTFIYKIFNQVNTQVQSDPSWNDAVEGKSAMNNLNNRYISTFDNFFIIVFILLWVVSLVASYMIDTHPIFFVFSLILLIAIFFIIPILGNSVETIMLDNNVSSTFALFPKTQWILTHLLQVGLVIGSSIMLVLFGKNSQ